MGTASSVLIADDDEDIRALVSTVLTKAGFRAEAVAGGHLRHHVEVAMGDQHVDDGPAHRLVVVGDEHADRAHAAAGVRAGRSEVTTPRSPLLPSPAIRPEFQDL